MIKLKLTVAFCLLSAFFFYSNAQSQISEPAKYIETSTALNSLKFRDFATSPLFYSGLLKQVTVGRLKTFEGKERFWSSSYSFGKARNETNNHYNESSVSILNLSYSKIYPFKSNEKWNLKIGGCIKNTVHLRSNASLQNNATGVEFFTTLFATGKFSYNISNKSKKRVKLLFIPITCKARKREITFLTNLAVMNNTFRNGYAYADQADITNDSKLFDDYKFKMFSGYRINTELAYTIHLENRNAFKFAYEFDGYKTGGDLDKFELASHKIKFSLLFKTR